MAFTLINDFSPTGGPIAASASPGAVGGNGWIDIYGSQWSVNASNQLKQALLAGSPWNTALLGVTGAPALETQIDTYFVAGSDAASAIWHAHRTQGPAGNATAYLAGVLNSGQIKIGTVLSSTVVVNPIVALAALTNGTTYMLRTSVVQTNSTTTTVTAALFQSDGVTQIGATATLTDSSPALQNAPGYPSIFIYQTATTTSAAVSRLKIYNTLAAATAVTLTGPTNGLTGSASSNFTVGVNNTIYSGTSIVVTPSDSGGGGTFTPTSVTLTPVFQTATFTYTPATNGSKTISVTNGSSLTNPASLTYVAATAVTIPVTSAGFKFSPGNWKGDTGRGGSAYRQSWVNGAWFMFTWLASSAPQTYIKIPASSSGCYVSYEINGVLYDNIAVASGNIAVQGVTANAVNTIIVRLRSSPYAARWNNAANVVQIQGMIIDSASTVGTAPAPNPWVLLAGDSNAEGVGPNTSLQSFVYYIMRGLDQMGFDTGVDACGFSGWLHAGDNAGDVPAWYSVSGGVYSDAASRWNKIDSGVSRLDANGQLSSYGALYTPPAGILVNFGTNEAIYSMSTSDMTASIIGFITAARAAAPTAVIGIIMPFGLRYAPRYNVAYVTALLAGVAAYQTANPWDTNVVLIDLGATFAAQYQNAGYTVDTTHGNQYGQAVSGVLTLQKFLQYIMPRRFSVVVS